MICGIDIGGTNTAVGLVSKEGKIIDKEIIKTTKFFSAKDLVLAIAESIFRMCKLTNESLEGIGIGCPNGDHYSGTMVNPSNLPFKETAPLVKYFQEYFPNIPISLTNDANAAAIGEKIFGSAKNLKDFVVITIGTGLGSGFFVNNKLVCGCNGMAGEVGHIIVKPNGRPCNCGRNGCLEKYVSASGIVNTYNELCVHYKHEPKIENYKDLCALAEKSDHVALETFDITGEILGATLANLNCFTAPSHIFLFGGVTEAGNILLKPCIESFEKNLLFSYKNSVTIERSTLQASNAAVLGAAALIFAVDAF